MFGWGKRAEAPAGRLAALLADYPPFAPPHRGRSWSARGYPATLTLEQCRENLASYRAAVPERLEVLARALAGIGVDAALAWSEPVAFVRQLHPALLRELPALYRPEIVTRDARDQSDRAGDAIALSFMGDLAMLEADVLLRARPGCFIGLDLDPADREMPSFGRPCVLGLVDRLYPDQPDVSFLENEWFGYLANMDDPSRLAPPDGVVPAMYPDVIGGAMLQRLDRAIVDPRLEARKQEGWWCEAVG